MNQKGKCISLLVAALFCLFSSTAIAENVQVFTAAQIAGKPLDLSDYKKVDIPIIQSLVTSPRFKLVVEGWCHDHTKPVKVTLTDHDPTVVDPDDDLDKEEVDCKPFTDDEKGKLANRLSREQLETKGKFRAEFTVYCGLEDIWDGIAVIGDNDTSEEGKAELFVHDGSQRIPTDGKYWVFNCGGGAVDVRSYEP